MIPRLGSALVSMAILIAQELEEGAWPATQRAPKTAIASVLDAR